MDIINDEKSDGESEDESEKEEGEIDEWLESSFVDMESKIEENETKEMKIKEQKALLEMRCLVEDAILDNYILDPKPKSQTSKNDMKKLKKGLQRDITLWGIPLLPSKGHEGTDIVLLKFLRAKDFKVEEAFDMLRKTLIWRKEYKTDAILEENLELDLDLDLEKVLYMNGVDRQGHPLYYAMYGAFRDKELHSRVVETQEDREKLLRWRIQLMEKTIKKLSFKAGGTHSILQITDFKSNSCSEMKELRSFIKKACLLLSENYPEIVYKNILINVPFWYYTCHFVPCKLSQRCRSKFIVARRSKVARTLLKYISAENLPVEYGGLKRESDAEFSAKDSASELIVRANSSAAIKIPVSEGGVRIVWDFTVVGWEVTCKEEFIPNDEGSYRVVLRKYKEKRMGESIRNSFYIYEPGKLLITIHNTSLKKRLVYYRSKTIPYVPTYINL